MSATFTPEVELLLACARMTMREVDRARAAGAVAAGVNGDRLLAVARQHRMVPLLHRHASRGDVALAPGVVRALATLNARVVRHNLLLTAGLLDILDRLGKAGILAMPFKGPMLAEHVYGSIGLRQFGDLDVLVPARGIGDAIETLALAGYRRRLTAETERDVERRHMHHVGLVSQDAVPVELHRSLISSSSGRVLALESSAEWVTTKTFSGRRVLTLSDDALTAYLCEHGGGHAWSRIEWIATAAECMRRVDTWEGVRDAASRMGSVGRLRAAGDLFDLLLESPGGQRAGAANALVVARLASDPRAYETIRYQLLTDDGWMSRGRRIWAQVVTPHVADARAFGLGRSWRRMSALARPARLLIRAIRGAGIGSS